MEKTYRQVQAIRSHEKPRFTPDEVRKIRDADDRRQATPEQLAEAWRCSKATIYHILNRTTYKDVS